MNLYVPFSFFFFYDRKNACQCESNTRRFSTVSDEERTSHTILRKHM